MTTLSGTVLLGVTGGIAAYKAADLTSKLRQRGLDVQVVMTAAAQQFVTARTFEYLSNNPVITDLWTKAGGHDPDHVAVSDAADVAVVAPATANIIGKLANGIADDALSTILMATQRPLILAPAMNERMYENPAVQENLQRLRQRGARQVGPGQGWLACGAIGVGRMADVADIIEAVVEELGRRDLQV